MTGMKKVVRFPSQMLAPQFEAVVHDRSRFSHEVVLTDHMRLRMMERDITFRQILNVLRKGAVVSKPVWRNDYRAFEAKMAYVGAGTHIVVVCAIQEEKVEVVAITTY